MQKQMKSLFFLTIILCSICFTFGCSVFRELNDKSMEVQMEPEDLNFQDMDDEYENK